MKAFAVVLCICYICATIYGLIHLQVDSIQPKEVKDISYFSHFEAVDLKYFPREYIVSFTITKPYDYQNYSSSIQNYMNKVQKLKTMQQGAHFWLNSYKNGTNIPTTNASFTQKLASTFLPNHPDFKNDIVISEDNATILASRFYMKTADTTSTKQMIILKKHLKKIYLLPHDFDEAMYMATIGDDDDNDINDDDYQDMLEDNNIILANSPDFIHTDSYRLPLIEIIRIAAGYLATSGFFTLIFVPHPLLLFHMAIMFVSFLLGIIGLSYFIGIYLTPVPMIVIMICSGYGIEVIVHSYYAYMTSLGTDRGSRTYTVLSNTSPFLFHTNFASFLGLLVLIIVKSYVFQVVFRLLEISLAVCVLYAVFLIPVALAFTGPGNVSLPGKAKVVRRNTKAAKTILDQVGTQMSNGFDPHIQNGGQTNIRGVENLGFEKV